MGASSWFRWMGGNVSNGAGVPDQWRPRVEKLVTNAAPLARTIAPDNTLYPTGNIGLRGHGKDGCIIFTGTNARPQRPNRMADARPGVAQELVAEPRIFRSRTRNCRRDRHPPASRRLAVDTLPYPSRRPPGHSPHPAPPRRPPDQRPP